MKRTHEHHTEIDQSASRLDLLSLPPKIWLHGGIWFGVAVVLVVFTNLGASRPLFLLLNSLAVLVGIGVSVLAYRAEHRRQHEPMPEISRIPAKTAFPDNPDASANLTPKSTPEGSIPAVEALRTPRDTGSNSAQQTTIEFSSPTGSMLGKAFANARAMPKDMGIGRFLKNPDGVSDTESESDK